MEQSFPDKGQLKEPANGQAPLGRCILLESRYSVRGELLEALNSSALFSEVVEAQSLRDGLHELSANEYDACILGTTVSRPKAVQFVNEAAQISRSRKCAFITLVSEGDESVVMPVENTGMTYQALRWPASPEKLSEGIVIAVKRAEDPSKWTEVRLSADKPEDNKFEERMFAVLSSEIIDLGEIVDRVRTGELTLDDKRRPSPEARLAIHNVVINIFGDHIVSQKMLDFKKYFEGALILWFVELVSYSVPFATGNLRRRLQAYVSHIR